MRSRIGESDQRNKQKHPTSMNSTNSEAASGDLKGRVIGLVGGIASGKSQVAKILSEMGSSIIDADVVSHQVRAMPEVVDMIAESLGQSLRLPTNPPTVDKVQLSTLVFGDSAEHTENRKVLESIVHPRIHDEIKRQLRDWRKSPAGRAMILDIPLLFEKGWEGECDEVWFVDTPRSRRLEFAKARGWSEAEFDSREEAQWSIDKKRMCSSVIVANDSTIDDLRATVRSALLGELPNGRGDQK